MTQAWISYEDQRAVMSGELTLEAAQGRANERLALERDSYREALERIERVCGWSKWDGEMAVQIAREALHDWKLISSLRPTQ